MKIENYESFKSNLSGVEVHIIGQTVMMFKNGLLHSESGPAIIGDGTEQWFLCGQEYTEEDFKVALTMKAFW